MPLVQVPWQGLVLVQSLHGQQVAPLEHVLVLVRGLQGQQVVLVEGVLS